MATGLHIGFLLFPDLLQMDLTGPYGVFAAAPDTKIDLIWKTTAPIRSSDGLLLTPTLAMQECPPLDIICVPGGKGILPLLGDAETLAFLHTQAGSARYVASVCTGALVLGAAGLLGGYKATTHWQSWDMLAAVGALPQHQRVVVDGNRITAAGVSAGIDMALTLTGMIWGEETAATIELSMEYAPEPPFGSGTPETAPPQVRQRLLEKNAANQQARLSAVREAAVTLQKALIPPVLA